MADKRSFFERLTGTITVDDEREDTRKLETKEDRGNFFEQEHTVGELAVDVFQTPQEIFIKTMIAGVKPEDLDITITRDSVTITGKREDARTIANDDYFLRELYWGEFSRTIMLPAEVEAEDAEAYEKHGLLVLRLPKIDKEKQTKVRVRTN
jgi:HSP20 family protein